MSQEIQAIRFDVEEIGKHVKSSKKRFSWILGLNNRNHTIVLDFSFISSKAKLVVDRKTILETQLPDNVSFQHPFTLDGFAVNILQQGQSFQLRINNKVFSHLYNQARTKNQFKNYQDEVKDIKVDENLFQNITKNVKINIGALNGAKKKNKNVVQTQNWGNFGGNQLAIPSYFNNLQESNKKKQKQEINNSNLFDLSQEQTNSPQKVQKNKPEEVDFFADNDINNQVLTSKSSNNVQQHPNNNDVKPLENLLENINIQSTQPEIQHQQSGLDLLESVSLGQQSTNYNNENTFQNLFIPQNQYLNYQNQSQIPPINLSPPSMNINNIPKTTNNDLIEMQNIFSTAPYGNPSLNNQSLANENILNFANLQNQNQKQYNTMKNVYPIYSAQSQQMDAPSQTMTNTNSKVNQNYQSGIQLNPLQTLLAFQNQRLQVQNPVATPSVNLNFNLNLQNSQNTSGFGPMQNIFSSKNHGGIDMTQFQTHPPAFQNISNFNNLNLQNKGIDFNGISNTSNQQTPPIFERMANQNENSPDFNTMQNLFKTNPNVAFLSSPSPPVFQKKENVLDLLGSSLEQNRKQSSIIQNKSIYNTFSGPKSTGNFDYNATSYGTIQPGNIDFFQVQPIQQIITQTPQLPNFTKKKQSLDQDLI